jgi:hypothetical protein
MKAEHSDHHGIVKWRYKEGHQSVAYHQMMMHGHIIGALR